MSYYSNNLNRFMIYCIFTLFLFFSFFPYIKIIPTNTDMQPYSFMFALLIFTLSHKSLDKLDLILLWLPFIGFFLLIYNYFDIAALRNYFGYLSLFFIANATYTILDNNLKLFLKFLRLSFLIWIGVAVLQEIFNKEIFSFLLGGSVRTSEDRGVTSLAAEPTYFGIVLLFYIIYFTLFKPKNYQAFIGISAVFIMIVAKSSMATLFLGIMLITYTILKINIKYIIAIVVFTPFILNVLLSNSDTRLSQIVNGILENPLTILLYDASVNDRVFHIYFSFLGFFENFGLPHGYLGWDEFAIQKIYNPYYKNLVITDWFSLGNKINSTYGSVLFEMGLFGLAFPYAIFRYLYRLFYDDLKTFTIYFISISIILLGALPLSFPYIGIFLGILKYLSYNRESKFNY